METLQVRKDHLVSVVEYAKIVELTRGRIYQLINEKDDRIVVVEIAGTTFIDKTKSAKVLN